MKVGIVGAGIAGSYLAYRLSKKHDVTVFESKSEIGNKACSGLVSERLWDYIPKNKRLVKNTINKMIIHFKNKDVELELNPRMMILERYRLDRYIMSLGRAKLKTRTNVKKLSYSSRPVIFSDKGNFIFDKVIGCDGATSGIRKQLGGREPKYNLGILTYEKGKNKSHTAEIWPLKHGFAWKMPRGSDTEYGVFSKPDIAHKEFRKFYRKKRKIYSALIPYRLVNVVSGNVTLCGDATGLAKPWSGGGIIWTLKSADILVRDFPDFKKYNEHLKEFFEPRIFFSEIASKLGMSAGKNTPWLIPKEIYFDSDWIF